MALIDTADDDCTLVVRREVAGFIVGAASAGQGHCPGVGLADRSFQLEVAAGPADERREQSAILLAEDGLDGGS